MFVSVVMIAVMMRPTVRQHDRKLTKLFFSMTFVCLVRKSNQYFNVFVYLTSKKNRTGGGEKGGSSSNVNSSKKVNQKVVPLFLIDRKSYIVERQATQSQCIFFGRFFFPSNKTSEIDVTLS